MDPNPARSPPVDPERIIEAIRARGPALVALSGGVDSSLVASYAFEALGPDALAVTLTGVAVAAVEVHRAEQVAQVIGIRHVLRPVDQLASADYRSNPSDRCFFCRSAETEVLRTEAQRHNLAQYLDGVHLDDLGDDRPGLIAMDRAGFRHPLLEARFAKEDVRREARLRKLPNWDQPSDACLASRVRHGVPITAGLLHRIEQGEEVVRAAGFRRVRIRVDGERARIEVDPDDVARLLDKPAASRITSALAAFGFSKVEIDPHGYRGLRVRAPPPP